MAVTDLPITFDFAPSQICVDVCVVQDRDIELASEQFSLQLTPPQQIGGNLILATDFIFVFILDRTGSIRIILQKLCLAIIVTIMQVQFL